MTTDYEQVLSAIRSDERYLHNLDWGQPRPGHPEGTVRAHIQELEGNLHELRPKLSDADYWKLQILIHTHDSFKAASVRGVSIRDARSHASIARAFLQEFCDDEDLLAIVQYHDEPYALWRQRQASGRYDESRLATLLEIIADWDLFLAFLIVDGCTEGKSRGPLTWFFAEIAGKVASAFSAEDVLQMTVGRTAHER